MHRRLSRAVAAGLQMVEGTPAWGVKVMPLYAKSNGGNKVKLSRENDKFVRGLLL
jgi:hypothetical protein